MTNQKYFLFSLVLALFTFIIGYLIFRSVGEVRYVKFQLAFTLLFAIISMITYGMLKLQQRIAKNRMKNDIKAIGISMSQSLIKLVLSLGLLIPFYLLYCPITNFYLLNFIITYIIYTVFDTYMMTVVD